MGTSSPELWDGGVPNGEGGEPTGEPNEPNDDLESSDGMLDSPQKKKEGGVGRGEKRKKKW